MTHTTEHTADLWRRFRAGFKGVTYSPPGRDRWQQPDRVMENLDVAPGQRVADLGSGSGYFTRRLAQAAGPTGVVYAVDTDPDLRWYINDRARRHGWSTIVTVEAHADQPALPEPVDLALLVDVFHHLPDLGAYLSGLAGHLRPGGRVAIIEALPKWYTFGHSTDPQKIRSAMADAGYTLAEQYTFIRRQSFQIFTR